MNKIFIILICLCSCRSKETDMRTISRSEVKRDSIVSEIKIFNSSFYDRTINFDTQWGRLLTRKDELTKYIIENHQNITIDRLDYINRKNHHPKYYTKDIITSNSDYGLLYLVCGLYYKDYFFALSRRLYDSSHFHSGYNYGIDQIPKLDYSDSLDMLWKVLENWQQKGMNGRPFQGTSFFWLGESGGSLNSHNTTTATYR